MFEISIDGVCICFSDCFRTALEETADYLDMERDDFGDFDFSDEELLGEIAEASGGKLTLGFAFDKKWQKIQLESSVI